MNSAAYRLFMAAVTLGGVATIVFVLLRVVPGDPIAMMISPGATPADIATLRAHYGLDASLPVQFLVWIGGLLRGDFGTSISLHRNVLEILGERLPATLELAAASLILAAMLGGAVAVFATLMSESALAPMIDAVNGLFLAVPDFIWAFALVLLFGVLLPVLPLSGRIDPGIGERFVTPFYLLESLATLRLAAVGDLLRHMILPTLALGLPLAERERRQDHMTKQVPDRREPQSGEALQEIERGHEAFADAGIDSARQRQHRQKDAKQQDEREGPDEVWHCEKEAVDCVDHRGQCRFAHQRREHRDRAAEHRGEDQGSGGELERGRQALAENFEHVAMQRNGRAEIASQEPSDPDQELHGERGVEAVMGAERRYVGRSRARRYHHRDGIAGHDSQQHEHDRRDAAQGDGGHEKAIGGGIHDSRSSRG